MVYVPNVWEEGDLITKTKMDRLENAVKENSEKAGTAGPQGPQGEPGEGVPTGGTAGQVLVKKSAANYDTEWKTLETGGGSETSSGVSSFNGRTGAVTPQEGDYTAEMVGARSITWMPTPYDIDALPADTFIPSKTSELTNDSGFSTKEDVNAAIQAAIIDSWEASY